MANHEQTHVQPGALVLHAVQASFPSFPCDCEFAALSPHILLSLFSIYEQAEEGDVEVIPTISRSRALRNGGSEQCHGEHNGQTGQLQLHGGYSVQLVCTGEQVREIPEGWRLDVGFEDTVASGQGSFIRLNMVMWQHLIKEGHE